MLWTKESKRPDAMYVDLYGKNGGKAFFEKTVRSVVQQEGKPFSVFNKNDAVSVQKRNDGNQDFRKGEWKNAMGLYNESLCYAESGSKNISLAYANRSACFLELKMYNECLIDIQLAKDSGYPEDLMSKLDERKEKCLKAIDEGDQPTKFELKLSFEPDEHVPFMANVLKLDRSADGSLAFFAKEDIDVGQTIVEEQIHMTYLYMLYDYKCNICLKDCVNLVPCKKCTVAMFCSEGCVGNSLHDYECGLRFSAGSLNNGTTMRVVRNLLLAINLFSNAEELMDFVEHAVKTNLSQLPSSLLDPKSKYAAFLKLPVKSTSRDHSRFVTHLTIAFSAQKMLMKIPKIKSMFAAEKHYRFLMHLILQHYNVMEQNSIVSMPSADEALASDTALTLDYFKHSCAPNVMIASKHNGKLFVITVRPIKKGEQIQRILPNTKLLTQPTDYRQLTLRQRLLFECKCERCEGATASKSLRKRMRLNPDFQQIMSQQAARSSPDDDETKQEMVSKCKSFLQKYGQSPFCNELGRAIQAYESLMRSLM